MQCTLCLYACECIREDICICVCQCALILSGGTILGTTLLVRASPCSQNGLSPSGHQFYVMLETFRWDSVHVDMTASHHFCRFVTCNFMLPMLFYHIPKVFCWIPIWWLGTPLKFTELIDMFVKPAWVYFCFVTCWFIILEFTSLICLQQTGWFQGFTLLIPIPDPTIFFLSRNP